MKAIIYKDDTLYRKGDWQLFTEDGDSITPYVTPAGRPLSGFPSREAAAREALSLQFDIVETFFE